MRALSKIKNGYSLFREFMKAEDHLYLHTHEGFENLVEKALNSQGQTLEELFEQISDGIDRPSYQQLARQGFVRNHVTSHVICGIAQKAAHVRMFSDDPVVDELLQRPAPNQSQGNWMIMMMTNKLIDGNAYAELIPAGGFIQMMKPVRPDRVRVRIGSNQLGLSDQLLGYTISQGIIRQIELDVLGNSESLTDMFHTLFYDPLRDHIGLSKMIAAFDAVKQNNEISTIHEKVLKNDGALPGFITLDKSTDSMDPNPTEKQMINIRNQVNKKLGVENRGKWAVFSRAFKFIRMGANAKEMDWMKVKESTAREIAMAFNYPAMLLGFPTGATFNNVSEALRELWTGMVIPNVRLIADDLEVALSKHRGRPVEIQLDTKEILAIQEITREKRKAAREDMLASVISREETRVEGEYPEEIDGDLLLPNTHVPLDEIDSSEPI